jgi:plasmid maintenance system antidote protein VapI
MSTTTNRSNQEEAQNSAELSRIHEMSAEEYADYKELLDLWRDATDATEKQEIRQSISELLFPGDIAETVDLATQVDRDGQDRLELYQVQVGKAIRARRETLNMTQQELADAAEMQQTHLSRLELGQHQATGRTIRKLAKALKTTPGTLDPGFDD